MEKKGKESEEEISRRNYQRNAFKAKVYQRIAFEAEVYSFLMVLRKSILPFQKSTKKNKISRNDNKKKIKRYRERKESNQNNNNNNNNK